jgi:glucose/arabinose dehydrogenase
MYPRARSLVLSLVLAGATFLWSAAAPIDWPGLIFTEIATGAMFPVHVTHSGDGSGRLFIVEQSGRILVTTTNGTPMTTFLDLSERVHFEWGLEDGLLNLVFSTNYAVSGKFYVYYTRTGDLASVISRFSVSTNSNVADQNSEEQILVIPEISEYTLNGGMLAFGPDGYLYIGTGDDGYYLTAGSRAQEPFSLWGKILRIDVASTPTGYVVPPSNPFIGRPGYAPEIWALGFRNPWRFSFDRANGDLYVSDVGQFIADEIDYEPSPSLGGRNYGWRSREGIHAFFDPIESNQRFVDPVFEVVHDQLTASYALTGGYVYRGPHQPRLNGMYFFADVYSGLVQGMVRSNGIWTTKPILQTPFVVTSFGEDQAGQLYITDYVSGGLYRLDDSMECREPVFDPAGPVSDRDSISVTSLSTGAVIHFTTNGIDPTESDSVAAGSVTIASGTTLKARAFRTNLQPSAVTAQTFALKAAKPSFVPDQGLLTNNAPIAISSVTPGAIIRYTLDGAEPTSASTIYPSPVLFFTNQILKARAFRAGFADSDASLFHSTPLRFQNVSKTPFGTPVVTWSSMTGQTYRLQYSPDFTYWANLDTNRVSTSITLAFTNYFRPHPHRAFYRVQLE